MSGVQNDLEPIPVVLGVQVTERPTLRTCDVCGFLRVIAH